MGVCAAGDGGALFGIGAAHGDIGDGASFEGNGEGGGGRGAAACTRGGNGLAVGDAEAVGFAGLGVVEGDAGCMDVGRIACCRSRSRRDS